VSEAKQMKLDLVHEWTAIRPGAIVRGNWSQIQYKVEHVGSCKLGGWVAGRCPDNPRWTGSFSYLGKRSGNLVSITDPNRPKDKLIVLRDK